MQLANSTYLWPGETHFGFDTAVSLPAIARSRGATALFIIADPGVAAAGVLDGVRAALADADLPYVLYSDVVPNPDVDSVHRAAAACDESDADLIVGIGGGSALDTAKAVKLFCGGPADATIEEYAAALGDRRRPYPAPAAMLPYVAMPTTAGTGAEVTPWAVLSRMGTQMKFGVGNWTTIPDVAILDPQLTLSLPPRLTAATGMDALSHLIEAYVSTKHNPILDPLILHGIRLVGRYLPAAVARGDNGEARYAMLQASMIGGIGITSKWLGACHSLAHPLSGIAGVHHGLACGMMLPPQMAYSMIGAVEKYAAVAAALAPGAVDARPPRERAADAATAVRQLLADVGLPTRLRDAGVTAEMIPALGEAAYADLNWWTNPRQVSEAALTALYEAAF